MKLKFLTTRLKQIKLNIIWVQKQLKFILSSKDLLEKYEHFTGEDLGHRPSAFEKAKFEYSPLGMSFSKAFEKDKAKSGAKSESDFNYDTIHKFYKFFKGYGEFEEMSLGSKYKKINEFNKRLIKF